MIEVGRHDNVIEKNGRINSVCVGVWVCVHVCVGGCVLCVWLTHNKRDPDTAD